MVLTADVYRVEIGASWALCNTQGHLPLILLGPKCERAKVGKSLSTVREKQPKL